MSNCKYDVCLSYASEDRDYVEQVAEALKTHSVHVFYDQYEQVELWGKNLYDHLSYVYMEASRYCVVFISEHYKNKLWTDHERKSAQARAFQESREYVLPVRFDDTRIPGIVGTVGYIDARRVQPKDLALMIERKIRDMWRRDYFPTVPTRLLESLCPDEDEETTSAVNAAAQQFFRSLLRMNEQELKILFRFLVHGCPAELPENVHINQDLLSRCTESNVDGVRHILGEISSLGFFTREREHDTEHLGDGSLFVLEWHDMTVEGLGNATEIANEIVGLVCGSYCEEHGEQALMRRDFSVLEGNGDGRADGARRDGEHT